LDALHYTAADSQKSTEKRCHHRRMIGFNYADPEDCAATFAIGEQKRLDL